MQVYMIIPVLFCNCFIFQAPRVPVQALAMVVPPQEPDQSPANVGSTLSVINKGEFLIVFIG